MICMPVPLPSAAHSFANAVAPMQVRALEALHALGALDSDARLSRPLGTHLAELPLEPVRVRVLRRPSLC